MSETVPGECRSNDCVQDADWFAKVVVDKHATYRRHREWEGEFCHPHLMRCIEMKLEEMHRDDYITIERIKRR